MRAWRLHGLGGAFHLEEVPKPEIRPGAALVRVEASTLMSYMKAYVEGRLPGYHPPDGAFTPGGNCVGTIERVGSGVCGLHPGQRVILSPLFTSGKQVPDPAQILIGVTAFGPSSELAQADWRDGTLADYALLPASSLVPVDAALADIDSADLAVASRFVVPYGGLVRGRLAAGETLIVTGATGAYGSAAVLLALAMGSGRVVAAGRDREKLARLALVAGPGMLPVALTNDRATDAAALREAAGGGGELAFDMVGGAEDPHATLAALDALRRRGRLVLMGSMRVDLPLSYLQVMLNGLEVIGNFMHPPDAYRAVLALVRARRLDLRAIQSRCYPLPAIREAMLAAENAHALEAIVMTH